MTFIDLSTAAHAAAAAPTRTALRAGALITAAHALLTALETGTTITSAMLREAMVAAFDPHVGHRSRDRLGGMLQLVGRAERVTRSRHKKTRQTQRRQVLPREVVDGLFANDDERS